MRSHAVTRAKQPWHTTKDGIADKVKPATKKFEKALTDDQQKELRIFRMKHSNVPDSSDILQFTTELEQKHRSRPGSRQVYKDRLIGFLANLQPLLKGIDVAVGGSQNIIACSVWGAIRMCLQIVCNRQELFDKLTILLMDIGRVCPDYADLVQLFPNSSELRKALDEYLAVVIDVCTEAVELFKSWTQATFANFDARFKRHETKLKTFGRDIERKVYKLHLKQNVSDSKEVEKLRQHKQMHAFLNACSQHKPDDAFRRAATCGESTWVQKSQAFHVWRDSTASGVLWCEGKLGSGKSVSAAKVVESLKVENVSQPTSFFFCEYDNEKTLKARTILGSLAKQLLAGQITPETQLDFKEGDELRPESIFDHMERILPGGSPGYYLLIDGINECPELEIRLFVRWLQRLLKLPQIFRVYLSVRSVMLSRIKLKLQPQWTLYVPEDRQEINFHIDAELARLMDDGYLQTRNPELIKNIKQELLQKCDGMFLWLKFQLERICHQRTDSQLRQFLEELPKGLEATYDRIIRELSHRGYPNHDEFCRSVFAFVACAKRPLSLDELAEALSVQSEDRDLDQERVVNDMKKALEQLGSLVIFDEVKSAVHFAHHSVRDHIMAKPLWEDLKLYHISKEKSELWLGEVCVTYLNFRSLGMQIEKQPTTQQEDRRGEISVAPIKIVESLATAGDHSSGHMASTIAWIRGLKSPSATRHFAFYEAQPDIPKEELERSYPFLDYAMENWLWHTVDFQKVAQTSFASQKWHNLLHGGVQRVELPWVPNAYENLEPEYVKWAFEHEHTAILCDIANRCMSDLSANSLSFEKRQKEFLGHFLGRVENLQDEKVPYYFGLGLQVAVLQRDYLLIEKLIQLSGLDVDAQSVKGTALNVACYAGEEKIVGLLLKSGANAEGLGGLHGDSLQAAAAQGHTGLTRILLEAGANVNSLTTIGIYGSALRAAAENGHLEIVRLLVNAGADPRFGSYGIGYPLEAAAGIGNCEVLEYLLRRGANVNAIGGKYGTALNASSKNTKNTKLTKVLLSWGADIHIQAGIFGNALQSAAASGHMQAVSLLLDHGADCHAVGDEYLPALVHAAGLGNEDMVRLLIAYGADINQQGGTSRGGNALNQAAMKNKLHMVRFLLENGAKVEGIDSTVQCLHGAAKGGHVAIATLLLASGADVNAQERPGPWNDGGVFGFNRDGIYYITALHWAAKGGHTAFVDFLLTNGADINLRRGDFPNALFVAAHNGENDCVKLLLDHGANIVETRADGGLWDALKTAQFLHYDEVVATLEEWQNTASKR